MLYEYQTVPMLEKLRAGELDMGVLALPVEMDGLDSRELYEEPFVVALPSDHPLTKKTQLRIEDLDGVTMLLLEDGHCLRDQALDACSRVDVNEKQDFRATSIETLRQMVAIGAGVTLLPELASRGGHASPKGLVLRPFVKPVPTRRIGAIWRRSNPRTAVIEAVSRLIAEPAL
jgi:LysR family hydrogen peroxide-inducible transcriptional activator